ncbi:LysR family transcriptional regulator [Paraburkholderia jirisanensis]
MNQIYAMRVFVRVAEMQSFRLAAQQLQVSNALVTRLIVTLEAHLQVRLINRTTRNLALTEAGVLYLEGCRALLEELDCLDSAVASGEREPGGLLRVTATGALAPQMLALLVEGFRMAHPKIKVQLTVAEQFASFVDNSCDVGIVSAFDALGVGVDCAEMLLETQAFAVCATPAWLARHGSIASPEQLAQHPYIALSVAQRSQAWRFAQPGRDTRVVTLEPVYTANSAPLVLLAALAGLGIAVLPAQLVAGALQAGALARLLPDFTIDDPHTRVSLVYPRRQHLPARTRAFVDFAVEHAAGQAVRAAQPEAADSLDATPQV